MLAILALMRIVLAVSTADTVTLHDAARDRDIPVKIYYPSEGAGPFPLIVFSHGYGGTKGGYAYLGEGWANAGYVVICPTHFGSDRDTIRTEGLKAAGDPAKAYRMQMDRAADVAFVLTSLDEIEKKVPVLKGKIDRERIGVGGHSMGGGTTLLVGGANASIPGIEKHAFRDARVHAIVAMSPQGSGEEGFDEHSWDEIRIPAMTMSGTNDFGFGGHPPRWRLEPFQHMPAGDKYQVTVRDAGHMAFATGTRFHGCIVAESLAFWDAYLKRSAGAKSKIKNFEECTVSAK